MNNDLTVVQQLQRTTVKLKTFAEYQYKHRAANTELLVGNSGLYTCEVMTKGLSPYE
jgi:hypothetical protein